MPKTYNTPLIILLPLIIVIPFACSKQTNDKPNEYKEHPPLVIVNNEPLFQHDIEIIHKQLPDFLALTPTTPDSPILSSLVHITLLAQHARKNNFISDEQIKTEIHKIKRQQQKERQQQEKNANQALRTTPTTLYTIAYANFLTQNQLTHFLLIYHMINAATFPHPSKPKNIELFNQISAQLSIEPPKYKIFGPFHEKEPNPYTCQQALPILKSTPLNKISKSFSCTPHILTIIYMHNKTTLQSQNP